jgi:hypothetical protein
MAKVRLKKFTVLLPEDLVRKARRVSRKGITPTFRDSLEAYAAREIYDRLLRMRGKGGLSMTWQELRGEE